MQINGLYYRYSMPGLLLSRFAVDNVERTDKVGNLILIGHYYESLAIKHEHKRLPKLINSRPQ